MTTGTQTPKFLAVDFFCGAGGTTRGLLDAGGYVIAGIDKDESCRQTYEHNNKNATLDGEGPAFLAYDMFPKRSDYPQGQQHEIWDRLKELIPHYRQLAEGVPLMFAICAPCQSYTKFVQRRITQDRTEDRERDRSLLSLTHVFIEQFEPEMIVSENVASIETGVYKQDWKDFRAQLNGQYDTGSDRICTSKFGIPQVRRRSILKAIRRPEGQAPSLFFLPIPIFDPDAQPNPSIRDAIGHLPTLDAGGKDEGIANHQCRDLREINRNRLTSLEPGEPNWELKDTEYGDLRLACHKRMEEKGKKGFGDVNTRMHPDRPSPTITTKFHSISNGRFGHYDREQIRGLSLREGATLQSFPEEYVFYGNGMESIARMIGNAVPPKLSAFMAKSLHDLWRERTATPKA